MPPANLIVFCEAGGASPFIDWFGALPNHAKDKVTVRLRRLRELGHELRRPEADYLRDGIWELRASIRGVHYRVLYFFHGRVAAVMAQGLVKERRVPDREIEIAVRRKALFEADPQRHTREEIR